MSFYCQVRWLSRGNILGKIFKLKQQIVSFYEKQKKHFYLSDFDFIRNAAFLCDLISISISIFYFCSATTKTERNKQTYRTIAEEEKGRSNKTLNVIACRH